MLFETIINHCDSEYSNKINCNINCNNKNFCSNNKNLGKSNCLDCLNQIHYKNRSGRINYDCKNLVNFYTCRHLNQYCSEIEYLLDENPQFDIPALSQYNILSLGCGPCPDLMAFEFTRYKLNMLAKPINYYGIDINQYWKPIHDKVKGYSQTIRNLNVQFENKDANDLNNLVEQTDINIFVLQYFFSFFYIHGNPTDVSTFIDKLIEYLFISFKKSGSLYIIINDTNTCNLGRDNYPSMLIKEIGKIFKGTYREYYFDHKLRNDQQKVGTGHPDYRFKHNPFDSTKTEKYCNNITGCKSYQMIIELTGLKQ